MSLLVLHTRSTPDDQAIWQEATKRGWRTERVPIGGIVADYVKQGERVRYYGNVLHAQQLEAQLPLTFTPIDPLILPSLGHLTKRRIERVRRNAITVPFEHDTFVKSTGIKWIDSRVYKAGESLPSGGMDDDEVYVQEVVRFINEVRCFVLDGRILTSSYYRVNGEFSPEWVGADPIKDHVQLTDTLGTSFPFPRGVVLDYGQLESGEWTLIEANEAWASGLYDCDPDKALDAILASQVDR